MHEAWLKEFQKFPRIRGAEIEFLNFLKAPIKKLLSFVLLIS